MSEYRENLLSRIEIVSGYMIALDRPEDLLRICAGVDGDLVAARSAVAEAFGVSEIVATAILHLQVFRFTPAAIDQVRNELADLRRQLVDSDAP